MTHLPCKIHALVLCGALTGRVSQGTLSVLAMAGDDGNDFALLSLALPASAAECTPAAEKVRLEDSPHHTALCSSHIMQPPRHAAQPPYYAASTSLRSARCGVVELYNRHRSLMWAQAASEEWMSQQQHQIYRQVMHPT